MAREVSKWITVNGNHVPIYEGESKADVRKRIEQLGSKKGSSKKSSAKSEEATDKKKESVSSEPKDVFEAAKAMSKGDGTVKTKNSKIIKAYKSNGSYGVVEHPDGSATIMDKKSDAWKKHSEGSSEKETKIDGANTISKKDFVKKYAEEYGMDADDFKQKGKDIKNFIIPEDEENPYIGVEYSDGTFWRYGTGRDLEVSKKELAESVGKPTQQDKDERVKQKQIAKASKQKDDLNKNMDSKEEDVFTTARKIEKEGSVTTKNAEIIKAYKSNGSYAVSENADGSYNIMKKGSDAHKAVLAKSKMSIDPVSGLLKKPDIDIGGDKYKAQEQVDAINYMYGYDNLPKARKAILEGKHSDDDIKRAILYYELEGLPYKDKKAAYEKSLKKYGLEKKGKK